MIPGSSWNRLASQSLGLLFEKPPSLRLLPFSATFSWLDRSSCFNSRLFSLVAAATCLEKKTGTGSDCLRQVLEVTWGDKEEEDPGELDLKLDLSDLTDTRQMSGCCDPRMCRFLGRETENKDSVTQGESWLCQVFTDLGQPETHRPLFRSPGLIERREDKKHLVEWKQRRQ